MRQPRLSSSHGTSRGPRHRASPIAARALLGASLIFTACAAPAPPRRGAPVEPLVIGTSSSVPTGPTAALASTSLPIAADNPPGALAIAARDPRIAQRVVQRPRAILRAEIQSLDTLLTATSKASPDRPALARRLADNYAEVARQTDGPEAKAAHESAAKYYELLAADYPQQPQVDEAFYYLGLESELAGNVPRARVAYLDMLRRVPSSKLAPLAYFAFGEIFRDEAVTDPQKIDFAKQAYVEVLKYPAPNNPVFADAKRRLAEIKARLDGAQP